MRANALVTHLTVACALVYSCVGDIYMHNPRGSNNRNCRRDNNDNVANNKRLFDSQNNNNGGYNCPRAWPFDCYKYPDAGVDTELFNSCRDQNPNPSKDNVNKDGSLNIPGAVQTPTMYYYGGSQLQLEFTVQHGMGANEELHSNVVVQYTCEEHNEDNCGDVLTTPGGQCRSPFKPNPALARRCGMRDGTPVRNVDDNVGLNVQATNTIGDTPETQDDYRYGRHESYNYYQECTNRERNKGLFTADQNVGGRGASGTRQNPNGQRYGLECPEESEYWPYWHHSPWRDIAVITENEDVCEALVSESQNVKPRGRCDCGGECPGSGRQPNNQGACERAGFTWCTDPAHGLEAPECVVGPFTRQNHLGNAQGTTSASQYNWTLPEVSSTQRCVLRVRYNISTSDGNDVSVSGTAGSNQAASPIKDVNNNEAATYQSISNLGIDPSLAKLGFKVNTNQYGRTFQDRSYMFEIRPAPEDGPCEGRKIHNLNVRGRRGNIVQTYPAVEYDFVPTVLVVPDNECVHVQWTGSDYNTNRDGNNGEGGPYRPDAQNQQTTADRTNLGLMKQAGDNFINGNADEWTMLDISKEQYKRLLFLDQPIDNPDQCWSMERLLQRYPGSGATERQRREDINTNCMKLSGAKTPYFDLGAVRVGERGMHHYISSRNNNFSNRGMKGTLVVVRGGLSPGAIVAITLAVMVALGGGLFAYKRRQRRQQEQANYVPGVSGNLGSHVTNNPTSKESRPSSFSIVGAPPQKDGGDTLLPIASVKAAATAARWKASASTSAGQFAAGVSSYFSRGANATTASAASTNKSDEFVRAQHYHSASEPGELNFKKGDRIRVINRDESGWWEGENTVSGETGLFPSNYCAAVKR